MCKHAGCWTVCRWVPATAGTMINEHEYVHIFNEHKCIHVCVQAAELMAGWVPIDTADALELLSPAFKNEEVRPID